MGTMLRITANTVMPAPGQRVLKEADLLLMQHAQSILDLAQEQAERILQDAKTEYARQREQGYQDGKTEGKMEHAEKIMDTILSSVEFIENIESTLVHVVSQAIRKIIGEMDDAERIVRVVRTALLTVRNQQHVTIRVAPADAEAVRVALAGFLQSSPGGKSFLDLIPDARLDKGACLLESELGVVDASLETQLKALENAFHAKIKS
ncbi:MAG: HrpE/YscL family type III secretion apparatus protein [Desulfovibrionales bacterium]|nr:HrpE/YscL family type III secretion apparatus protein [Desulfovibrionales bacterium]